MKRAYILLLTRVGQAGRISDEVGRIDGVTSSLDVTGPYDVVVEVEARDAADVQRRVVPLIQAVGGITRMLVCPVALEPVALSA